MTEAFKVQIRKVVELAKEEWRLTYPDFIEIQARLKQISYGMKGLAATHGIEIDGETLAQMEEFASLALPRKWPKQQKPKSLALDKGE